MTSPKWSPIGANPSKAHLGLAPSERKLQKPNRVWGARLPTERDLPSGHRIVVWLSDMNCSDVKLLEGEGHIFLCSISLKPPQNKARSLVGTPDMMEEQWVTAYERRGPLKDSEQLPLSPGKGQRDVRTG